MATGRTHRKNARVYVDGFDMSGFSRTIGPLEVTYDEADLTADMGDTVKGYLRNHAHVNVGTLNALFDNTATVGPHAALQTAGARRTVLVAQGIRAAPAAGDPAFGGQFTQGAYTSEQSGGGVFANLPFVGWAGDATTLGYASPWGVLLHASGAETAVNSSTGVDGLASSATGGFLVYQVLAGNGTATISVQDAATNADGSFAALTGATTGSINCAVVSGGLIAIGNTATVRRYLRWQVAFGTATTVSFALAFMRG